MAGSILRVGLALTKCPHFHRVYLVRVPFSSDIAVHTEADIGPQSGLSNEIPHNIVLNSFQNNLFLNT